MNTKQPTIITPTDQEVEYASMAIMMGSSKSANDLILELRQAKQSPIGQAIDATVRLEEASYTLQEQQQAAAAVDARIAKSLAECKHAMDRRQGGRILSKD